MRQGAACKPIALVGVLIATAAWNWSGGECRGGLITLSPAADGFAADPEADGIFNSVATTGPTIPIRLLLTSEVRGLLEFDISPIPSFATIESVALQFSILEVTSNTTEVAIYGYSGDGLLTVQDATRSATQVALYDPDALGLGVRTVNLDTGFFQSSLGTSDFLGLRLQGTAFPVNTSIAASESGLVGAPQLLVGFTADTATPIPEPSSLALLGIGVIGLLGYRLRP